MEIGRDIIHFASRSRIDFRANARAFSAKQSIFRTYNFKQQLNGIFGIEHGIKIKFVHTINKAVTFGTAHGTRLETAKLIRHRATTMRDNDLQIREIFEDIGIDQTKNRRGFLIDKAQRIRLARRS